MTHDAMVERARAALANTSYDYDQEQVVTIAKLAREEVVRALEAAAIRASAALVDGADMFEWLRTEAARVREGRDDAA